MKILPFEQTKNKYYQTTIGRDRVQNWLRQMDNSLNSYKMCKIDIDEHIYIYIYIYNKYILDMYI